jgi:glycosyltransferase involved in cell wall biosynthesis
MSRKKILWLCSWYPNKTEPFNGDFIERHGQAASLYNDIYVIHVANDSRATQPIKDEIQQSGSLRQHITYFKRSYSFLGKLIANLKYQQLYRRAIRKYIIDHGLPDIVHVHVPLKAGLAALWISKRKKIPIVLTEHWGIYNSIVRDNFQKRGKIFRKYTKMIIEKAGAFTSVSRYLGDGVNNMVAKKEYRVIPNVVNTDLFYLKARPGEPFRFLHVSNMVPLKNAEGILRAFKRFNENGGNAELIMVGDTEQHIRDSARELGLIGKTVFFRGEIPYAEVAKEMQQSHCLVLFSDIENSPCVISEALCCGLPVIATLVGGIPELVKAGTGILVDTRDETALVNAMREVKAHYHDYDHKKIAEDAKSKFSYSMVGKLFDEVYRSLLG